MSICKRADHCEGVYLGFSELSNNAQIEGSSGTLLLQLMDSENENFYCRTPRSQSIPRDAVSYIHHELQSMSHTW